MSEVVSASDIEVQYARDSDVLYLTRKPGVPAHSREGDPGLVWRHDTQTGDLIGLTIVDFMRYWRPRRSQLIEQVASRFAISPAEATAIVDGVRG